MVDVRDDDDVTDFARVLVHESLSATCASTIVTSTCIPGCAAITYIPYLTNRTGTSESSITSTYAGLWATPMSAGSRPGSVKKTPKILSQRTVEARELSV